MYVMLIRYASKFDNTVARQDRSTSYGGGCHPIEIALDKQVLATTLNS